MKKLLLSSLLVFALMPSFSSQAQDDSCFMVLSNGKRVNLGALCGQDSSPKTRPQQTVTPVQQTVTPVRPTSQTDSQSKQSRCPAGFKITKYEFCRSLSQPLVNVSGFKVTSTENPYLFSLTYTVSNAIEVSVKLDYMYLQITGANGAKTKLIAPSVTLQPNQTLKLNAVLLDSDLGGAEPSRVLVNLDRVEASENN